MIARRKTLGIIGLGAIGGFIASLASDSGLIDVVGCDTNPKCTYPKARLVGFDQVAQADVIVLAIPLQAYENVLQRLSKRLKPETLVVDICSVKVKPEQYLDRYLPNHPNLLVTHPLFGPQSAGAGTSGHKLVVTGRRGALADEVLSYCRQGLGLEICEMTSQEHDKAMAQVQGLTFFLARGLSDMNLSECPFTTPSYQMITDLISLDRTHTDELFRTIQDGNPFAAQIRQQAVEALTKLNKRLSKEDKHGS